jgi:hypothetical protein
MGVGSMGMGFQCQPDRFDNRFNLIQNLIVPEPHDSKTLTFQYLITNQILRRSVMLPAIYLNNQLHFQTNKIQNKISERMLASEFAAFNLTSSQPLPKRLFSIRHIAAKCSL